MTRALFETASRKDNIRQIGPEEAKEILGRSVTRNRPLKRYWVRFLAQQMKAGKWYRSNDALAFDSGGSCINGQHRLNAVILSETEQPFLVLENVSREEQLAMDQGLRRSPRDIFILEGLTTPREAITMLRLIEYLPGWVDSSRRSPDDLVSAWQTHEDAIGFAILHAFSNIQRIISPAVLCVVARAYYAEPERTEEVARFGEILRSGDRLDGEEAGAIIQFRNYLTQNLGKRGFNTRIESYQRGQNAMAYWLERRVPKVLRNIEEDLYPLPFNKRYFTRDES